MTAAAEKEICHEERDSQNRNEDRSINRGIGVSGVRDHAGVLLRQLRTLILLQKLMGGTVEPTLIARAIIVMGIVVGIACAAAVCLVVGGPPGTVAGVAVFTPAATRNKQATAEKA